MRRLTATLRKLVLRPDLDSDEVGFFGTALWTEVEEVCRLQGVELKMGQEDDDEVVP